MAGRWGGFVRMRESVAFQELALISDKNGRSPSRIRAVGGADASKSGMIAAAEAATKRVILSGAKNL